jgi:phosphoribosylformylglycinamidine synthase I
MKKIGVVVFPGSNCDHDAIHIAEYLGAPVVSLWHREASLQGCDVIVLPGGFSYGDYLRTGALATLSPIMDEVKRFADKGGPVVGICNGFQILCEAGLLPGVLLQNIDMRFLSRFVTMKIENDRTPFTKGMKVNDLVSCPIAHMDGNYFADEQTLAEIEDNAQVVFRYVDAGGNADENDRESNPNGSAHAIAGICNKKGNIIGLMPHPERSSETVVGWTGGESGKGLFQGVVL